MLRGSTAEPYPRRCIQKCRVYVDPTKTTSERGGNSWPAGFPRLGSPRVSLTFQRPEDTGLPLVGPVRGGRGSSGPFFPSSRPAPLPHAPAGGETEAGGPNLPASTSAPRGGFWALDLPCAGTRSW